MHLDLTDDEHAALVRLLRRTLDETTYPMAPLLDPPKSILAKLEHPAPLPVPPPPLRPGKAPSQGQWPQRRR